MIILDRADITGDNDFYFPEPPQHGATLKSILLESSRQAVLISKCTQAVGLQISRACNVSGKDGKSGRSR